MIDHGAPGDAGIVFATIDAKELAELRANSRRYLWLRDECKDLDIRSGFAWFGDSWNDSNDVSIDKEIAKGKA